MTHEHARAAILSVGDEIVLGQSLNTNSRWLSDRLVRAGVSVRAHTTVPDDLQLQAEALRSLALEHDLVVCTGGLGPTADDLTRGALARAMDDELVEDTIALAQVQTMLEARGRALTPHHRAQAMRPARAHTIPNLLGTAPGLWGTLHVRSTAGERVCDVACLPGPPREMMTMFESHVLARLRPPSGRTVRTRVLHTFGLAESDVAIRLGELMERKSSLLVGTTASGGVVSVRLRYEGPEPPAAADVQLDELERRVREGVGEYLFGRESQTLEECVLALLRARRESVGCVESCTGGALCEVLTRVPGSSASVLGALVTYSNELKNKLAGVDASLLVENGPGAVSAECASAMALGGLEGLGVAHCLAITGIAGPDGARPGKPVGTVFIARASRGATPPDVEVRRFQFTAEREHVRDWSCRSALAMLWQHLSGLPPMKLLREQP
jgi:nicotinamide-nucleotide amidase